MVFIVRVLAKVLKFGFEIGMKFFLESNLYGQFSLVLTWILLLYKFILFGTNNFVIKKIPRIKSKKTLIRYIFNNIYLMFFVTIIISILFYIPHVKSFVGIEDLSLFVILLSFMLAGIHLFSSILKAKMKINLGIWFSEIQWYIIFFILMSIYMMFMKITDLTPILYLFSISLLLTLIMIIIYFFNKQEINIKIPNLKIEKSVIYRISKSSLPVLFTGFSYTLLSRMDIIMLNNHVEYAEIGNYNVVARISALTVFFSHIFSSYYVPRLSTYIANGLDYLKLSKNNTKVVSLNFHLNTLLFIGFIFLEHYFGLFKIFGVTGKVYLQIFIWFGVWRTIYSLIFLYNHILYFKDYEYLAYINNTTILISGIILNYFMIRAFGVAGAAIATVISSILGNIMETLEIFIIFNKLYFINRKFIKIFIISIIIISSVLFYSFTLNSIYLYISIFSLLISFFSNIKDDITISDTNNK